MDFFFIINFFIDLFRGNFNFYHCHSICSISKQYDLIKLKKNRSIDNRNDPWKRTHAYDNVTDLVDISDYYSYAHNIFSDFIVHYRRPILLEIFQWKGVKH